MQFDNKVVGHVIKELRIQKGMTQELLSGFAGIARSHLSMIESGTKQANFETIWKLSIALGLKPSELVRKFEEKIER